MKYVSLLERIIEEKKHEHFLCECDDIYNEIISENVDQALKIMLKDKSSMKLVRDEIQKDVSTEDIKRAIEVVQFLHDRLSNNNVKPENKKKVTQFIEWVRKLIKQNESKLDGDAKELIKSLKREKGFQGKGMVGVN